MQCPKCQGENEPGNRFCIFCGSILPEPEKSVPTGDKSGQMDDLEEQAGALHKEVRRLSELVELMNRRLAALEKGRAPSPEPTPPPAAEVAAAVPASEAVPPVDVEVSPVSEPAPAPSGQRRPARAIEREWEQILGGNWLARIGVLALIIGVGFFLKFAFDNNWLVPTARVILGTVAGLVMLGGGHYWRRRYPTFAQAISGGGIALLYLSIFAAYVIFNLIGFYPAIALLLIVSIASAVLALRYNSMALAILGIIGAFCAPFVLATAAGAVTGTTQSFWLLVYVMVVDLGVLWLSTFRNWRWFTLLALVSSLVVFGVWYDRFGDEVSLLTSMGSLTLIFLIFIGATMLYHIIWRRAAQAFDYALMIINAAAYFGISFALLWDDLRAWVGGFSVLLALFYGGLGYITIRRGAENVRLALFTLGIALVCLSVAIPAQLGDKAWTTIAWAALGTVLMWLSFRLRMTLLRGFSYAVFIAVIVRLLFFDTTVELRTFTPILNERFLAFLVSIAAMYLVSYILWRERRSLPEQEQTTRSIYPVFLIAANFLSIFVLSVEVWGIFSKELSSLTSRESIGALGEGLRSARNLSLTALWAVYAVILLVVGIARRSRPVRLAGLALFAVPIIKVFVYDVFALEQIYRIIAFIGLGVLLVASGYLYQRYRSVIRGFVTKK